MGVPEGNPGRVFPLQVEQINNLGEGIEITSRSRKLGVLNYLRLLRTRTCLCDLYAVALCVAAGGTLPGMVPQQFA
jgi:hypothetical protein